MAATTVYSSLFTAAGRPIAGRPRGGIGRSMSDGATVTVATTSLDEANDRVAFIPVPDRAELTRLFLLHGADLDTNATETLDMDVVLYSEDADGNVTETILYNAGTAFEDLVATVVPILLDHVRVPRTRYGFAWIGLKVNTAAATAQAGAVTIQADWVQ